MVYLDSAWVTMVGSLSYHGWGVLQQELGAVGQEEQDGCLCSDHFLLIQIRTSTQGMVASTVAGFS